MAKMARKDLADIIKGTKLADGSTGADVLRDLGVAYYTVRIGSKYSSKPGVTLEMSNEAQVLFSLQRIDDDRLSITRADGKTWACVPTGEAAQALRDLSV